MHTKRKTPDCEDGRIAEKIIQELNTPNISKTPAELNHIFTCISKEISRRRMWSKDFSELNYEELRLVGAYDLCAGLIRAQQEVSR